MGHTRRMTGDRGLAERLFADPQACGFMLGEDVLCRSLAALAS